MELDAFAREILAIGREERAKRDASDVAYVKRLMALSRAAEIAARALLQFVPNPLGWFAGTAALTFHLSLDSQFMHAIQHGAYVGLPGAEKLTPERWETLAVPLRTKTWGGAHAIHHGTPSLPGQDPDTLHALYRVHPSQKWRPWHVLNTFLGQIVVFEHCIFTYDRLLKKEGLRAKNDRGELIKWACFILYQYVLFPVVAGARWREVLAAAVAATLMRNLVVSSLQMGTSVGHEVSLDHDWNTGKKNPAEWCVFQVETSKNWVTRRIWQPLLGGLDRHIEHHLFSSLPPHRLHRVTKRVRELCETHGVKYREYPSFAETIKDSLSFLALLARKPSSSVDGKPFRPA